MTMLDTLQAPSTLQIREAVRADLAAIVAILQGDVLRGPGEAAAGEEAYVEAFQAIAASPDNTLFVAELDGRVVGTCQLTIIPGLVGQGRTRAKLESVHVAAAERGKRIGEAMVRHAEVFAREKGAGLVELTSHKSRTNAHRFYLRLGYDQSHEGFKLILD